MSPCKTAMRNPAGNAEQHALLLRGQVFETTYLRAVSHNVETAVKPRLEIAPRQLALEEPE